MKTVNCLIVSVVLCEEQYDPILLQEAARCNLVLCV